jgi:hypothetical protein
VTEKARLYLENRLADVKSDPYALAVASYALHLANSAKKGEALKLLEEQKLEAADGTSVHWSTKKERGVEKTGNGQSATTFSGQQSQPADIEMSSYVF